MTTGDKQAATVGVSGCGICRGPTGGATLRGGKEFRILYLARTRNKVLEPLLELQAGDRGFGKLF